MDALAISCIHKNQESTTWTPGH
jgi:hypothetical protein